MSGRLAPLLSSARLDWETPPELFRRLDGEFRFNVDAAANENNRKAALWLGPGSPLGYYDALVVDWGILGPQTVAWLNPPYGRQIERWVKKAYSQARIGAATVVCLLPARTDTRWWHRYVMRANEVRFIQGRLKFVGAATSAPFPSVIVVFRCGEAPAEPVFRSMDVRG